MSTIQATTVALLVVMALHTIKAAPAWAQSQFVPSDMQRLIIFGPDTKELNYSESAGVRFLGYSHEEKTAKSACGDGNGRSVRVGIFEFKSEADAREQVIHKGSGYESSWKKISTHVNGADEAAVFDLGGTIPKCFMYQRMTFLAVGKWHMWVEESWRYVDVGQPDSGLAARLVGLVRGDQPLTPGEAAFRAVLYGGLGMAGSEGRACLDEVMNWAESETAKDKKIADDIARLREAAAKVHAIQVLAAVPVGPQNFDDFDPKWWDALKEVVPNPTSTSDPEDTATDRLVDLLPPPLSTVIRITRTGSKTMRAIKTHIVDPATHGKIYACYKRQRQHEGSERITAGMEQDALEIAAAQVLLDATGADCKYVNDFANSYERELGKRTGEARTNEYKRLIRPVAMRFEFIFQVEDAKARQQTLVAERWKPVQDVLDRLKTRVNTCIADKAAKSR